MKTKRTIFSLIVFLSIFYISILIGFDISMNKKAYEQKNENPHIYVDNTGSQGAYESRINSLSNNYGANLASTSGRLYLYEESDADNQTDQGTSKADDSDEHMPLKESVESDATISEEEAEVNDDAVDVAGIPDTIEEEILQDEEPNNMPSAYADIGISIANNYVNIRDKATTESEINGKLYKNSAARILDTIGDWYYIESGGVMGYIKTDYLKTGLSDEELVENYGTLRVSINTDGLNVREAPDIEAKKLTVVYNNEIYPVIELYDEWLKIDITDDRIIGYVSKEYVELLVAFEKAISKEEEEELKKLQEEERIKKETEVKYRDEVDYTQDELKLLACLVHAEAGNQCYEGKLAVANVVLNRVKTSKYPNSINDVIYQPGQFTVARTGSLAKQLDRYEDYSTKSQQLTIKAAKAALSGANNIGSRLYFHAYKLAVSKGYDKKKTSVKIEDHLFW